MNSYNLSRKFVDFSFENPTKIKPNHYALYFFSIEHCNRLGWKKEFGLPTTMTMEAIGIRSYNTYSKTFNDLVEYGFFKVIEKSKNQYSANIIALLNFDKALDKALDRAFVKHETKQEESTRESIVKSTVESIDSINKPITTNQLTNKPINNKEKVFNFRKALLNLGADTELVNDWLKVRRTKKATNSKSAFTLFNNQVIKSGKKINDILLTCIDKDWKSFNASWNIEETIKSKNNVQNEKQKYVAGRQTEEDIIANSTGWGFGRTDRK